MLPVRPVVSAKGSPIVEMMANPAAREDARQPVCLAAVLERAGSGGDVNVARRQMAEQPRIRDVGHVVDRVVEVEVVVVGAVHEAFHVVDAGKRVAAFDHVRVLEQGVGRVVRAERRPHRPDRRVCRPAMVTNERNDLVPDIGIVLPLHPAAMERVRALVRERVAVIDVDRERLDAPGVQMLGDGADQALALVFPFVSAAGRE